MVADFVSDITALEPGAHVLVLGDLNDFEFSAPLATLKAVGLTSLIETLPANERYTYVFEGNSQVLDHIMASSALVNALTGFDVVHANAEFAVQASDHDPAVARFAIGPRPNARVIPILECVERRGLLSWIARFGYDNPNFLSVTRAVGPNNRFVPAPADRSQPTLFAPGRQRNVFEVPFRGGLLLWTLYGRVEVASILARRCR